MTPRRQSELLSGQTTIAQKVYSVVPIQQTFTVLEIAAALKERTRSTADIHVLRGCLAALTQVGLVREVVPGSFRRVEVRTKEIADMPSSAAPARTTVEPTNVVERERDPLDLLAALSGRLRAQAKALLGVAEEIEQTALAVAARSEVSQAEIEKFKQFKALIKDLA